MSKYCGFDDIQVHKLEARLGNTEMRNADLYGIVLDLNKRLCDLESPDVSELSGSILACRDRLECFGFMWA